jgi:hypothetical protein
MIDYITILLVVILLFVGVGIILTPFLKLLFGKDVWKKFGAWTRSKLIKFGSVTIRLSLKSILVALKWLDDTLYKVLHQIIYKTPAPPRP